MVTVDESDWLTKPLKYFPLFQRANTLAPTAIKKQDNEKIGTLSVHVCAKHVNMHEHSFTVGTAVVTLVAVFVIGFTISLIPFIIMDSVM